MQFSSVPAWSFGLKRKGDSPNTSPGPGEYRSKGPGWEHGFPIAKSPRERKTVGLAEIGPGKYNTNISTLDKIGGVIQGRRNYPHE